MLRELPLKDIVDYKELSPIELKQSLLHMFTCVYRYPGLTRKSHKDWILKILGKNNKSHIKF